MKFSAVSVALLATPAVALQGYLSNLSSGSGAAKPASFAPSSGKPQAPSSGVPGSYLENMSGASAAPSAPAQAAPAAANAPPSGPAFSMSELTAGDVTAASSGDYLNSLKVSSAGGGSGPQGYLDTLRVQASQAAASKPAGYLDTLRISSTPGGSGLSTYKDSLSGGESSYGALKGAAEVTARVEVASETAMAATEPILAAINKLNEKMDRNHESTYSVLQEINTSVKKIAIRSESKASEPAETTELTSALDSSAGTAPSPQKKMAAAWSGSNWSPQ